MGQNSVPRTDSHGFQPLADSPLEGARPGCWSAKLPYEAGSVSSARSPPIGAVASVTPPP
jgi:hypothetical protein